MIVLADSGKQGDTFAEASAIHIRVTDLRADPDIIKPFKSNGTPLFLVLNQAVNCSAKSLGVQHFKLQTT